LSERVREIQERRARDAAREAAEAAQRRERQVMAEPTAPQLGLVPTPDAPALNPIVVAALKRIERAHQPMPRGRSSMGGAAVAVARVAQEEEEQQQYQSSAQPATVTRPASSSMAPASVPLPGSEKSLAARATEVPREHNLAVVPAQATPKAAPKAETAILKPQAKRVVADVLDDEATPALDTQTADAALFEELYDDRAPMASRVAGGFIDLLVVAFASSPFAAIIELTNGNWTDVRVSASMAGIAAVVMFLYLTASTAMTGRTWGMSLVSLRAVDADTGLLPTTKQAVLRALVYMISLATLGLGILYALFDAEGRAAHDHLSGTAVVRE
jgi:uncharacterized RDD family membrane protein YckC